MRKEKFQQPEFGMTDVDFLAVYADGAAYRVQVYRAGGHQALRMLWGLASEQCLDSRSQLAWRKRFRDVVVRPIVQAGDLVLFHAFRGQHDHRQFIELAVGAYSRQQAQAGL